MLFVYRVTRALNFIANPDTSDDSENNILPSRLEAGTYMYARSRPVLSLL